MSHVGLQCCLPNTTYSIIFAVAVACVPPHPCALHVVAGWFWRGPLYLNALRLAVVLPTLHKIEYNFCHGMGITLSMYHAHSCRALSAWLSLLQWVMFGGSPTPSAKHWGVIFAVTHVPPYPSALHVVAGQLWCGNLYLNRSCLGAVLPAKNNAMCTTLIGHPYSVKRNFRPLQFWPHPFWHCHICCSGTCTCRQVQC